MSVKIAWADKSEIPELQHYLSVVMGKIPVERWGNILDARWNVEKDKYAVTLRDDDKLQGYLGMVDVARDFHGVTHRVANLSSFYIDKSMRSHGLGQDMVEFTSANPDITYTVTSANRRSGPLLEKIGWQVMEDTRCFWSRPDTDEAIGDVEIISGDLAVAEHLNAAESQILNHHAGLTMTPHIMRGADGKQFLIVSYEKFKGEGVLYHEILHVGDPDAFSRYIRAYAHHVLPLGKAVLSVESRFLTEQAEAEWREPLECKRYFKPAQRAEPGATLAASDIDFLYTEVVLLDLKIY